MSCPIRTGVIGVGKMGRHHARIYATLPQSMLVGIYDVDKSAALACARLYGCQAFDSLEAFFNAGIEAVSIAVPSSLHAELTLAALEHGMHVLVEKPIATSLSEAQAMIQVAADCGRKLMVGHIERFNPAVQTIKSLVSSDEILSINIIRVGPCPPRIRDTSVIVDLAIHDIDLVRYITNQDISDVFCVVPDFSLRREHVASILLRTEKGISAQLTVNWITPYKAREIHIVTSTKLIQSNLITRQIMVMGKDQLCLGGNNQAEPLRLQIEAFLIAIKQGQEPPVTGEEGLRALEVALQAEAFKEVISL
ncbi:Gfo/Idh/MocA family protein [Rhodothermus profundi]|uniref:Predicted dehydrogenase n=1 Tax=Rhodothermus profundi TaxID=633813 RepID=A0A1M6QD34_9BACT|nr:Gfo/Idh/MocA family oxidoreductase [Rhodothermus profundi]SHK18030.1 Predicted dehydrogenase [Rhodothermus profundi]